MVEGGGCVTLAGGSAAAHATTGKVLLLSWTIPPALTGAADVVGSLAKQFSREEMVVAGERPHGRELSPWQEDWPDLVYLVNGWPSTRRGERWWRKLQFPLLFLRCLRLARTYGCTSIVTVFPSEEYLLAGYLTALCTGAQFFPYFHNTFVENRKGVARHFASWLQGRVFKRAAHVFVMSDGMVELYGERYPELTCSALVHSFTADIPPFAPPPEPGSPLRVMICGNIGDSCREATARVADAMSQVGDASLTLLSATARVFLERWGILRDGVRHETPDEIQPYLREADIALLPHGFSGGLSADEYRTIFPTRTLQYLICGRPILAHAPPGCYLTRFLRKHRCALIVDEPSVPALLDAIARLRSDAQLRSKLVRNALLTAQQFRGPRVAAMLRRQLQSSEVQ